MWQGGRLNFRNVGYGLPVCILAKKNGTGGIFYTLAQCIELGFERKQ